MKPISTRKTEIYHAGQVLRLEIEEYKTVYHVHFIDYRKYFSFIDTLKFQKHKFTTFTYIVNRCLDYALEKRYF